MRIVHGDAIADAAASTSGPWSGRSDERFPTMSIEAPAAGTSRP
jgi:hypothetical protein